MEAADTIIAQQAHRMLIRAAMAEAVQAAQERATHTMDMAAPKVQPDTQATALRTAVAVLVTAEVIIARVPDMPQEEVAVAFMAAAVPIAAAQAVVAQAT